MGVCGAVSVGSGMLRNMLLTLVSAAAAHGCGECSLGFSARYAASRAAHSALSPLVTSCSPLRINLRASREWLLSRTPIIVLTPLLHLSGAPPVALFLPPLLMMRFARCP